MAVPTVPIFPVPEAKRTMLPVMVTFPERVIEPLPFVVMSASLPPAFTLPLIAILPLLVVVRSAPKSPTRLPDTVIPPPVMFRVLLVPVVEPVSTVPRALIVRLAELSVMVLPAAV